MVDDIKPHIIGITESLANNDITNAELGLEGYGSFRVRSINFLLNLRDPPPISMKFGTLADNV